MTSILLMAAAGLAGVFVSGLLGVGGGVLFVPILVYLFHLDLHRAIGTSLALIIPTALFGVLRHYAYGGVDVRLWFWLSLFSVIGGLLGSQISVAASIPFLRKAFAIVLLVVSVEMFLKP